MAGLPVAAEPGNAADAKTDAVRGESDGAPNERAVRKAPGPGRKYNPRSAGR